MRPDLGSTAVFHILVGGLDDVLVDGEEEDNDDTVVLMHISIGGC